MERMLVFLNIISSFLFLRTCSETALPKTVQFPSTTHLIPLNRDVETISIDVAAEVSETKFFNVNKPVRFKLHLSSFDVDVVFMFNTSTDSNASSFNVYGSFCLEENRTEILFSSLKGPVSKMVSRKDLSSLRSRTKCNETANKVDQNRFYLMSIPLKSIPNNVVGSIQTFLLKNNSDSSKHSKFLSTNNSLNRIRTKREVILEAGSWAVEDEPVSEWYQNDWIVYGVPITIMVICFLSVLSTYALMIRRKRAQIARHSFQRNTVLQNTTTVHKRSDEFANNARLEI